MDADAEVREQVAEVSAGQAQQECTRLGREIVLGMTPDAVAGGRVVGGDVERLLKTDVGAARKVSASLSSPEGHGSVICAGLKADGRHETRLDEDLFHQRRFGAGHGDRQQGIFARLHDFGGQLGATDAAVAWDVVGDAAEGLESDGGGG